MDKQEILDRVLRFCDVRGDFFNCRREPLRSELFQIFEESQCGPEVCAAELHAHIRQWMEPRSRWDVPMQERVADICSAWEDWDFAVQKHAGFLAGA